MVIDAPLLRWIPLVPLAVAILHALFLGWLRWSMPYLLVVALSCGAVLASFVLSCFAVWDLALLSEPASALLDRVYTWFGIGVGEPAFSTGVAFRLDPLAGVMCLLITGVGSLVHVYAAFVVREDLQEEHRGQRLFCYLGALVGASLVVVLANDLVFLLVGWQGVGLASWLLLGFSFEDRRQEQLARQAFGIDRFGDACLLFGALLVFAALVEGGAADFSFSKIEAAFPEVSAASPQGSLLVAVGPWLRVQAIGLCFLIAAIAKSAQFPLHVWLRGAVELPVPAAALIHSVTTLAMGIYLLSRLNSLFTFMPEVANLLAWLGALTALMAALSAAVGKELAKVLSHVAVSQFGLMFLALGVGVPAAAVFHLITCAFSLSLLFLVAGAISRAFHGERNMERMGGLANRVPVLAALFGVGALALSGFPALSGFFSRDLLLLAVVNSSAVGQVWLYAVALIVVAATAFSLLRCFVLVFFGDPPRAVVGMESQQRSPLLQVYPLYALGFLAAVIGFFVGLPQFWGDTIGVPRSNSLATFLQSPMAQEGAAGLQYWMVALAFVVAASGYVFAWYLYVRGTGHRTHTSRVIRALQLLSRGKLIFVEFYERIFVRPSKWFAHRLVPRALDPSAPAGGHIKGPRTALRVTATKLLSQTQPGFVQVHVFVVLVGVLAVVGFLFLGEMSQ